MSVFLQKRFSGPVPSILVTTRFPGTGGCYCKVGTPPGGEDSCSIPRLADRPIVSRLVPSIGCTTRDPARLPTPQTPQTDEIQEY